MISKFLRDFSDFGLLEQFAYCSREKSAGVLCLLCVGTVDAERNVREVSLSEPAQVSRCGGDSSGGSFPQLVHSPSRSARERQPPLAHCYVDNTVSL